MKAKFGREIALLSLPVLLFGGAALLRSMNGRVALPSFLTKNPFDPGPIRLEYSAFQTIERQPLDVANGFDWGAQTTVREYGRWDFPKNWRDDGRPFQINTPNLRLVYRRGKIWHQVFPRKGKPLLSLSEGRDDVTFHVNLKTVPRDAEEVRLRGQFEQTHVYRGPISPGWKAPRNMEVGPGPNHLLSVQSKPFDIPIKLEGEPMPAPVVSKEPQLEIVTAKWIEDANRNPIEFQHDVVVIQFRRKNGNTFDSPPHVWGRNLQLFDAYGHKIDLFDSTGRKWDLNFWLDEQDIFSPNRSDRDLFAIAASSQNHPKVGWQNLKAPLRLTGQIGLGQSWPQKLDVKIEQLKMKTEDFGGPEKKIDWK